MTVFVQNVVKGLGMKGGASYARCAFGRHAFNQE